MPTDLPPVADPRLPSLLDALELLLDQIRAYELALPPNNHQALTALAQLREMAQQALNEASDLAESPNQQTIQPTTKHPLSPREHEVLTLAAQGLTNKEIAYRLNLSERTVQFHLNGVFNKTGTNSRTEATAWALRKGWL
ncbi:MAG TPA: response regulator transcription factor [Anaerolineales bacterium]|nr:response regulator transcription factor [Anaerolineales bacterium]